MGIARASQVQAVATIDTASDSSRSAKTSAKQKMLRLSYPHRLRPWAQFPKMTCVTGSEKAKAAVPCNAASPKLRQI